MSKIGTMRDELLALLLEHERDGALPTSARFLYYELVQRGVVSKVATGARRSDQIVHDALTDLREDGRVPWGWIVDETRTVESYTGHLTVKQGVLELLAQVDLDPWGSDRAPMVLTESRSVAGVLRPTVADYRARVSATNGQCGGHLRTEIAPRLSGADRVLYIGDYDLAGNQIEENTRRVLEHVVGLLRWERLALTADQVTSYGLPPIVKHDRRYRDGRPHEAVETEALSQTVIINILRARLTELLPEPLGRVQEREERERARLRALLEAGER